MKNNKESHITKGIRKILEHPLIYNLFQTLHGGNKKRELHFKKYFDSQSIKTILDIGCGSGVLLDYIKDDVEYHGCDMEKDYIDFALTKYGDRGKFYLERVGETIKKEWIEKFDAINAHGLLHHLNESDSKLLLEISNKYLKKGGFLLTLDPVYHEGQSKFSEWIVSKDRGQNVRRIEEYDFLANSHFSRVETELIKKHNRIYYSVYVMQMFK